MSHSEQPGNKLYGIMAIFDSPEALLAAAQKTKDAGFEKIEAYSPLPLEELDHILEIKPTKLPFFIFLGGFFGGLTGFMMQYFSAAINLPLNIGGRPLNSWVSSIPITFELTILGAALTAVIGMISLNKLPLPYHPVFNADSFKKVSNDRFALCIEAIDAKFDAQKTKSFLEGLGAEEVCEVAP